MKANSYFLIDEAVHRGIAAGHAAVERQAEKHGVEITRNRLDEAIHAAIMERISEVFIFEEDEG